MARQTRAQQRAEKIRQADERKREEERRRRMLLIGSSLGGILIVALFLTSIWPQAADGDTTADGWDLPALDGDGRVALTDFRGKPTVAAFFASWCEVCENEVPELLALSEELGEKVNFVGINSQDSGRGMADAEKWGIAGRWSLAEDIGGSGGSGLSTGAFSMRGMPLNVIYDAAGNVVHVQRGGLGVQDAVALLDQLTEFEL